jgi:hypothetical protein
MNDYESEQSKEGLGTGEDETKCGVLAIQTSSVQQGPECFRFGDGGARADALPLVWGCV